ncbi:MAG TPA: pilin [bacterium]|nr:pilin [bacterium]
MSFSTHKNLFHVHKKLSVIVTAVAIFTFIFVLSPVFLSGGVGATETGLEATRSAAGLPAETSIAKIIGQIIYAILGFLGVVFVILLIYGGFLRMTAQGDSGKIKTSTGIITSAVVGVVIILAAYTLTSFILSQVGASVGGGGEDTSSPSIYYPIPAAGCCELKYKISGIPGYSYQKITTTQSDCSCDNTQSLISLPTTGWSECSASFISDPCDSRNTGEEPRSNF